MYGLLNLHKPAGWTSHDCVARVRRLLGTKKVGHGGTLDPAATGVLPIAVGKATRLLQYLPSDKAYVGRIRLGLVTTTDDLEGEPLQERDASGVTRSQLEALLPQFTGPICQIPPRYSAIQVEGQRLYDLARQGKAFDVPMRQVVVHSIELGDWQMEASSSGSRVEAELAIACGPGTYIRSIARDLGAALGVGGCLASLIRTRSCGLALSQAIGLEDLEVAIAAGRFKLLDPVIVLGHLPEIVLSPDLVRRWHHGQRLSLERPVTPEPQRVVDPAGTLLGIGELQAGEQGSAVLSPKLVL
ncbi:MAG: tRNA pseudouridine(55) synthase TruB [Synechococcales cyanobacterium RM1_1_8]|nr:tRNA pseudouridine(55) synthase TruB [Synechococcales cyanobacterium RM1_1_8]